MSVRRWPPRAGRVLSRREAAPGRAHGARGGSVGSPAPSGPGGVALAIGSSSGGACAAVRRHLDALADGALGPAAAARARAHLAGCAECAAEMADLTRLRQRLRTLPPEPLPAGFAEGLRRRLEVARLPARRRWGALWAPAAAAAGGFLVAAALAAPLLTGPSPGGRPGLAAPQAGWPSGSTGGPVTAPATIATPGVATFQARAPAPAPGATRSARVAVTPRAPGALAGAPDALAVSVLTPQPAAALHAAVNAVAAAGGDLVETMEPLPPPAPSPASASAHSAAVTAAATAAGPWLAGTVDAVVPGPVAASVVAAVRRYGSLLAEVGGARVLPLDDAGSARVLISVFAPSPAAGAVGGPVVPAAAPVRASPRGALHGSLERLRLLARFGLTEGAYAAPWAALAAAVALITWGVAAVARRSRALP